MSVQRARSAVSPDHRSVHPNFPGLPWWGALLVSVTATAVGFAFDAGSGNRELSTVFSVCYAAGCILAVLVVRQAGLFTAVIQPPLLLFASVPSAYFLFKGGQHGGVKDLAINCGYPLIERFPLMFFTSAAVLLIGMGRWYLGMSARRATPKPAGSTAAAATKAAGTGLLSKAMSRLTGLTTNQTADEDVETAEPPRRRHTIDRPSRATAKPDPDESPRAARKPTKRATSPRSRHARPPETELIDPVVDRPRRTRTTRQTEPPSGEPRRSARSTSARQPRKQPPPAERRVPYERRERRRRLDDYEPFEPLSTNGSTHSNGSHHPVSRVRYRDSDDGESHAQYRTRSPQPRHSRGSEADSWEYDV